MKKLMAVPTTLKKANAFVGEVHRHHDTVVGHRFSFGAEAGGKLVGTVIVGRPVAPKTEQYKIAEVTRQILLLLEVIPKRLFGITRSNSLLYFSQLLWGGI